MKKKEMTIEEMEKRAKEIADKITIERVDQYNWRLRKDLNPVQTLHGLTVLAHFMTIPTQILNEVETAMFDEEIFEKINVSNPTKE